MHSLEALVENTQGATVEMLLPSVDSNTLEAAMERLDAKAALQKVDDLPELYKEVLLLRYVEGLSPKEIAAIVNETENVVSVRIHRALKKMKELLEETGTLMGR